VAYRGQAGTGRAGDSNDGMLLGHGRLFPRIGQKAVEQKIQTGASRQEQNPNSRDLGPVKRVASIRVLPLESLPYCYRNQRLPAGHRGLSLWVPRFLKRPL
jgi:hypothetical protein